MDQSERYVISCGLRCNHVCPYRLSALKHIMNNEGMELDIIVNTKVTEEGHAVLQVANPFLSARPALLLTHRDD